MQNYPITSLGCGLIGIGREWGVNKSQIPSESEAEDFLKKAMNLRIRFFDTAPAYGASEERLGKFLQSLDIEIRKTIFVATKCGEFWNEDGTTYTDHSFDVIKASVDKSIELLGDIQLVQIHKSSVEILASDDIKKLSEYIKSRNIPFFGVSISDINTGLFAASMPEVGYIQLPYNQNNHDFLPVIQEAQKRGKKIIVNRPFGMGKLIPSDTSEGDMDNLGALFRDIILSARPDIILTGTKTAEHLEKNKIAFNSAFHT